MSTLPILIACSVQAEMLVFISSHAAAMRAATGRASKNLLNMEEEMLLQDPDIHLEGEDEAAAEEEEEVLVVNEHQGMIDLE